MIALQAGMQNTCEAYKVPRFNWSRKASQAVAGVWRGAWLPELPTGVLSVLVLHTGLTFSSKLGGFTHDGVY